MGRYVGLDLANREGRRTILRIIPTDVRSSWLLKRSSSILHDFRFLEKLIEKAKAPLLFGVNSFPEADGFASIKVCENDEDFDVFINSCNQYFVESIENYGKSISKSNYYWEDIKQFYPSLWHALHRIKTYRINHMHLKLNPNANTDLIEYLKLDLESRSPRPGSSIYFSCSNSACWMGIDWYSNGD